MRVFVSHCINTLRERPAAFRDSEEDMEKLGRLEEMDRKIEQLKGRFDRLEASMTMRMDHLNKTVGGINKGKKPPPAPAAATVKAPAPVQKKAATTSPTQDAARKARYHVVKSGETLYSISRSNGLTVDEIRKMNKLSPGDAIHPGQKLIVGQ